MFRRSPLSSSFESVEPSPALWELWEKPERLLRRLFQVAVEIIKEISPKASLIDFHGYGSFHSAPLVRAIHYKP